MDALKSKMFLASVFLLTLFVNCWAMDQKLASNDKIIPIKNGLLTEINAIIYVHKPKCILGYEEKTILKRATLAKLVCYEKSGSNHLFKIFAPQVIKVTDKGISKKDSFIQKSQVWSF